MKNIRKNFVFFLLAFLICLNILAGIVVLDLSKVRFLKVIFFDVGQGDAIFIETPQRHQILIDGGPSSVILERLGKEMPFWDRTIDLVILTHPEKDHLEGLLEVLKRYEVENILWTGVVRETTEYKEWVRLIIEEKAKIFIAQAGQRVIFSTTRSDLVDKYIEISYPFENLEGREVKNSNDTSIVSRLVFDNNSFLFTGDIQKSAEKKLAEVDEPKGSSSPSLLLRKSSVSESSLDSDVLKVSHHGSKTSTAEEFIKKVAPEIAVISAGKGNSYGHPHQEVLGVLEKYGITVLRTDLDGDIKIISDGKNLKIR